jgi:hypothetical protein
MKSRLSQNKYDKKYLSRIVSLFSPERLEPKPCSNFSFYPYANDIQYLAQGDYLSKFDTACQLTFFSSPPDKVKNIGIVVGNGYILSLLPDLLVSDVLLVDIEPAVHYFILFLKDLILNTHAKDFQQLREDIKHSINEYCEKNKKYRLLTDDETLESEINALGSKHFLFSEERFNQCKQALAGKDLIPIKLNLLDYKSVSKFSVALKEDNINVSFINITNVSDYDRYRILYHNLSCLPLAKNFMVVSTSLISSSNNNAEFSKACLIAKDLDQLQKNLEYSYRRNIRFS